MTFLVDDVELQVDGATRRVPGGTTLAELLSSLGHDPQAVASAVNGVFVPRSQRASHVLAGGDAVMLFKPIVGG